MVTTVLSIVVLTVFVGGGLVLWLMARRTDSQMDFKQAEGMAKADDGLRLGIALSSNAQSTGF